MYIHLIVMFIYTFGTGWKNRGLHVHVLYSFKLKGYIEILEGKLPSADPHLFPMLFWILGNVKKHVNL